MTDRLHASRVNAHAVITGMLDPDPGTEVASEVVTTLTRDELEDAALVLAAHVIVLSRHATTHFGAEPLEVTLRRTALKLETEHHRHRQQDPT